MKKVSLLLLLIFLVFPKNTYAIYDPTTITNNHFGIHVVDTNGLSEAAKLTNSNGGDWGYVTFVIQKGDRDTGRWQRVFDEMRRLHLIPIVRIATAPIPGKDNIWDKPSTDEIDGWVSFLNSLNWVVKNRYITIGNEPNHKTEWGGEINPAEYARYLKLMSQKLKNSNEDFFLMPAGFDASASNTASTMDESLYLQKMFDEDPNVFDYIDGWASHSYPNPNFSGPPDAKGKGTVSSFEWELNYIKFLGVKKDLPVFITETGWTHDPNSLETNIGAKFEESFKNAWNKNNVIAITPFIFKYTDPPFDNFSWLNKDGKFYDFYFNVLNLTKVKGTPIQEIKGDILTGILPRIAMAGTSYHSVLFIKNTGQSIWQKDSLESFDTYANKLTIQSIFPEKVEPNQIGVFLIVGKFPNNPGVQNYNISITEKGKIIANNFNQQINIIPPLPNIPEILDFLKITLLKKIGITRFLK